MTGHPLTTISDKRWVRISVGALLAVVSASGTAGVMMTDLKANAQAHTVRLDGLDKWIGNHVPLVDGKLQYLDTKVAAMHALMTERAERVDAAIASMLADLGEIKRSLGRVEGALQNRPAK